MKKKFFISILLAAALALAGCSAASHSSGASQVTAIQAITNAARQSNKIDNMAMKMNMAIELNNGSTTNTQTVVTNSKFFRNPPLIYQISQIKNATDTVKMVQYVDDQAMYVQNSATGQWAKAEFSGSSGDLLKSSFKKQSDPATQLDLLKSFQKNMKLKKSGTDYVIQFGGKKQELRQFIQKAMMNNIASAQKSSLENALNLMNFTSMDYTYVVDQKTFNPKSLTVSFTAEPKSKDTPGKLKMTIQTAFSKINQLEKVTIPADVKKKAIKIDPAQLQGSQY
ncbi:hypothetical protein E4665_08355 [Sporolactobacillus shoreae]|uniref:Lipoprotein n=1 Tax=Sporolactobacillus shoreae TaxID=1465501 RepID=A0A4Z0GNN1_9BACL|nr:DUF6612 family protein [Sporolactobacillus shoreae]TGA98520.1 hypothetical protein E4665_08355 [Sporolactobacillus shoreae]